MGTFVLFCIVKGYGVYVDIVFAFAFAFGRCFCFCFGTYSIRALPIILDVFASGLAYDLINLEYDFVFSGVKGINSAVVTVVECCLLPLAPEARQYEYVECQY